MLGNILIGGVVTVIAPAVLRPILVGVMRAGYEVKDYAASAWTAAKQQAAQIRDEAKSPRGAAALESEIQQLRNELAALKAGRKTS